MKEKKPPWKIPKEWPGETAVIIGGGPSLRKEDVEYAKSRGWRRVVCNNAYVLDPEADVLVWGDRRWYDWNKHDLRRHVGTYKVTWQSMNPVVGYKFHVLAYVDQPPVLRQLLMDISRYEEGSKELKRAMEQAAQMSGKLLAEDPGTVAATNTGQGAINVAYHFGAIRIVLLGFDMRSIKIDGRRRLQWHNFHHRETELSRYREIFAPAIRVQAAVLRTKSVEVVNCTPDSALRGVPIVGLADLC